MPRNLSMEQVSWRVAAVAGGLLAGGVIVAPEGLADVLRLVLLVMVAAALLIGVLARRPASPAPWWLMTGAVTAFAIASVMRLVDLDGLAGVGWLTDLVVLGGYLALASSALGLARLLDAHGEREGVLDGAIVAVAVAMIISVVIFRPELLAGGSPSRIHLIVGPLVFAAIAGIITRFALLAPRGCLSAWLLVAGTVAGLSGNLLRTVVVAIGEGYAIGSLPDALLLAGYVLLAVAALHPSTTMLFQPVTTPAPARTRTRLTLLGGALLVPPLILLLEPPDPGRRLAPVVAAVVNVLVLWRLGRLLMERERTTADLRTQSRHDPLTGLTNRVHVSEVLDAALARARRTGGAVALLFCDLDNFKAINDHFGHGAGDRVLIEIAERMQRTVRAGETVARLSGDEFVVVVEGIDDRGARSLARRLEEVVGAPIELDGHLVALGVSVGVGFSDGNHTPDDLLHAADAAMYEAKRRMAVGRARRLVQVETV